MVQCGEQRVKFWFNEAGFMTFKASLRFDRAICGNWQGADAAARRALARASCAIVVNEWSTGPTLFPYARDGGADPPDVLDHPPSYVRAPFYLLTVWAERQNGETGVFVRAEEVAFLEEARRWRQRCVLVLTRAKPQGPLYNATSKVIDAIDDVAEVVTGDRRTFYQRNATTPGENLPPMKWRTVE